jgi:zinc protease
VLRKTDDVPHDKVWLAWHSPALYADGDADLDVLSSVLSAGKDSRLYLALVKDKQIAKDIEAYQVSMLLGSFYVVEATASKGHTTDELVAEIDALLASVVADGPTDEEVTIAKTNWEAKFYRSLQSISTKSNQLNQYYIQTGNTDYIGTDLGRYLAVTAASVKSVAADTLVSGRVQLHVTPEAVEEGK